MPREVLNGQSRKLVLNVLDYFQNKKENSLTSLSVIKCASEALKLSLRTVARIKQEGIDGAKKEHTRIRRAPKTRDLRESEKSEIRKVIHDLIVEGKHVTLDMIRKQLESKQILSCSRSTLGLIMKQLGFKYKIDNGRRYIMEKPEISSKRVKFLREYVANMTSDAPLDVVFLDETWIHQHGSSIRTWHDENPRSVWNKKAAAGKRYIIVHAGNSNGFIDGSELVFSTKNKSYDYHDNMNAELFEKWLREKLLPKLERPSLIIMDNARYHSRLSESVPNESTRKGEIINWLRSKQINFPENGLKCELLKIIKNYKTNLPYATDELIAEMGHQVLRLPPYHCIFNAIELVWAQCKGFFNKNIVSEARHDDNAVISVWKAALQTVTKENWISCITHTENIIKEYWQKENILDVTVPPIVINVDEGSFSDSSSSNFDSDDDVSS